VQEETGIADGELRDWQYSWDYEIYARWRHRYAPGVTTNTEHVFGLQVPDTIAVQLAEREHTRYCWLDWQDAAAKVFSPSNADAIRMLPARAAI